MQSKIILLFLLLISSSAFSQLDQFKWKKAFTSYEKPDEFRHREYSFKAKSPLDFIKKSFANAYWFFISDVDGDNCPFRPTCSAFFIQAINETDIFQASLMFFDRFTRDMNISKTLNHYPRVKSGYYYDSPQNYTLNRNRIRYLPSTYVVDE
jgi:putative component of membrane protein insertase Oxa1/YidC/SpoIIIJ protein YidD